MRYLVAILTVLLSVSGYFNFVQHQKLEQYRELSRVSDELILVQDSVITKQSRVIDLLSN